MSFEKPLIAKNKLHRPISSGEALDPAFLPLSARGSNTLRILPDGLYSGPYLDRPVYYVAAAGTDDPLSGSKATPYQTLAYAMEQLTSKSAFGIFTSVAVVALKAGETFNFPADFDNQGGLVLTFWGDTNYGDFDSPLIPSVGASGVWPALMSDLDRPVITVGLIDGGSIMGGVRMRGKSEVRLVGIHLELPTGPSAAGDFCTFLTAVAYSEAQVMLEGSIINRTDTTSKYGLLGLHARASVKLHQYGSALTYNGSHIIAGAATDVLLSRANFIRFYPDWFGNAQSNGFIDTGSPGSGMLTLHWSDVESMSFAGKTNLGTYPLASDPGMGLRNYFTGLSRDAQGRALNVLTGVPI